MTPIRTVTLFVTAVSLAAAVPASAADHLLISELVVTPTGGEFV